MLFNTIMSLLARNKSDPWNSPQLNETIQKWCIFLYDHFDKEFDHFVISSNKFTNFIQILQEKIESVSEGKNWRDAFFDDESFFSKKPTKPGENKNNADISDISDISIHSDTSDISKKKGQMAMLFKNKSKISKISKISKKSINSKDSKCSNSINYVDNLRNQNFHFSKSVNISGNIETIKRINDIYFFIFIIYPTPERKLFYLEYMKNNKLNDQDLYSIIYLQK
jgi:hypothetical protein